MANKIFDRDTLLDLTVNVVPLFIIAFFVVAFAVIAPFGIDPLASAIQFGLLAVPFVLLAILTYFAGRAVAGSEQSGEVYLPGQAGVRGAKPLEEDHGPAAIDPEAEETPAVEDDTEDADDVQDAEGNAEADGDDEDA
ncbi:DUF6684 family protein [Halobellus limi]|jgi:hypothetical protein|uniref:Cox cluster protein n=1 Tax=Halobellus limi TaxID=699433 RepID=A0A1H5ZPV5_9EURY|nr:DUF6684 family protein [Halobellus limi]QCC48007.1 cox cluster protein [Halobellus limi]SEG38044.1 hypothetical protein SAMN04488133_2102 [Halobellus limi]